MGASAQNVSQGMLELRIAFLDDQLSASTIDLVSYGSGLERCESGIVCSPCGLEHSLHRARDVSRPNEIDSLDVTTVAFVVDPEVELDKITIPNNRVVIAYMSYRITSNIHRRATVISPRCR